MHPSLLPNFRVTHFILNRFVDRLYADLDKRPLQANRLVHQAIQQCFVSSMVKFGFRLTPPCRTGSQISRSSPVHLRNVASNQQLHRESQYQAKLQGNQERTPSLLANLVSRCVSTEGYQTVLGILQVYLKELHTRSCGPSSLNVMPLETVKYQSDPDRNRSHHRRSTSIDRRVSAIQCSAGTGLCMLTSPLVLTCDSEASNTSRRSTLRFEGMCSEPEVHHLRNAASVTASSEEDGLEGALSGIFTMFDSLPGY